MWGRLCMGDNLLVVGWGGCRWLKRISNSQIDLIRLNITSSSQTDMRDVCMGEEGDVWLEASWGEG